MAQVATVVQDILCQLVSVSASNDSIQDPRTPSNLEPCVVEDEDVKKLFVTPSLVPRFAFADFGVTVFAYLPRRRLLTPRLGGGLAQFLKSFMWPCSSCSQPPWCSCSPALCGAFSYSWLSCCDCRVCARAGCCGLEVEDVVKVSGPISDAIRCACLCGCVRCIAHSSCSPGFLFAGDENLDFSGKCVEARTTGFPREKCFLSAGNATGWSWPIFLPR